MATTKKPPTKTSPAKAMAAAKSGAARGAALIAKVIEAIEAIEDGGEGLPSSRMNDVPRAVRKKASAPRPLSPELLAKLRLVGGRALPPSLAAWLAYDGGWQPFEIDAKRAELRAVKFQDLLQDVVPAIARTYRRVAEVVLPGDCYRVWVPNECSDDAVVFLYGPATGDDGEPPVVGFDFSDDGLVGVFACGFDVYMARVMGLCDPVTHTFGAGPKPYAPAARAALARIVAAVPKKNRESAYVADDVIYVGQLADSDV